MQEMWVKSLGWKDPLEKEMAAHSRNLALEILRTEECGRLLSMGSWRAGYDWACAHNIHTPLKKGSAMEVREAGMGAGWGGGGSIYNFV